MSLRKRKTAAVERRQLKGQKEGNRMEEKRKYEESNEGNGKIGNMNRKKD